MHRSGTTLRVRAIEDETQLLVLGGQPLDEPIAARGPFVMNTQVRQCPRGKVPAGTPVLVWAVPPEVAAGQQSEIWGRSE